MARARVIDGIDPHGSFRHAAHGAVRVRSAEVFEHAGRALDVHDIEGVHDMRVALRRLRATLELFAPCFPKRARREAIRELNQIADALGRRRDVDVQIADLEAVRAGGAARHRRALSELIDRLRAEQADANAALAGAVDVHRLHRLERRLSDLVERAA
jgi:CHAD domain-containing protein